MSKLGKLSFLFAGICVVIFAVTRFLLGAFVPFLWIPIGLFFLFILASLIIDRSLYLDFFTMRTTKHGMNMGALILSSLILIIAINYIVIKHDKNFDLSPNKINSLSDQSIKLLKSLDDDLYIRFFYTKGASGLDQKKAEFRQVVKKYQDFSNKVKLEFIDADLRPDLAEEYGVDKGGGIVFLVYKNKKGRIDFISEQEITKALLTVMKDKENIIYFLSGHGEYNIEEKEEIEGLNAFKKLLEDNRYKVKQLNLINDLKIPDDADILAIIAPKQSFLDSEVEVIKSYLKRGKSLFLALEQGNQLPDSLLRYLGVFFQNNYVFSIIQTFFGKGVDPRVTAANVFSSSHEITKIFEEGQFAVLKIPSALNKLDKNDSNDSNIEDLEVTEIVGIGDNSFALTTPDISQSDLSSNNNKEDGPFSLVMEVKGKLKALPNNNENNEKNNKSNKAGFLSIVSGDADFLTNRLLYQNLNRDLALNIIAHLSQDEQKVISITPKEIDVTKVDITPAGFYAFYVFAVILPIMLLIISLFLWFKRRNA